MKERGGDPVSDSILWREQERAVEHHGTEAQEVQTAAQKSCDCLARAKMEEYHLLCTFLCQALG